MGKIASGQPDLARRVATGSFTGTGAGAWMEVGGSAFNVVLSGTFVATVVGEYSFDGGVTAVPATTRDGAEFSVAAPGAWTGEQPEPGVLFRLRCASFTSGTVAWRISR
ncbi:hypothetical protein [Caldovatus aquaticus]|uniref:Uncharacterized protein n=1 Tax=Caldovatus aquaticus TaxID=2865671 RepID=A0ABS7EY46_9PROT|nr:hypothetical protein [Caldovatus aquaticus]MBW8268280.1 hypothetical protein [Caldovatus aquaticus]